MKLPDTVYLYWSEYGLTLNNSAGLDGYSGYTLLASAPVDFGNVEFDETEIKLKALNSKLGEAQHQVDLIKEEISKLLALGHDVQEHPPARPHKDFEAFDDDIPF